MGYAAQATCWSAFDLQRAVMSDICVALNRPLREPHLEVATALIAKTDLLLSGFPVEEHARVTIENEASKLSEASPWAADKRAAEIVRPAPVQTADRVLPKSLARDMACAKLQSRILTAAEAVQAAKLHSEILPEQQAIMLSACGLGTCTCLTAIQNWHSVCNGGWQRHCDSARHQMQARAPRVLCGKEMMETCVSSLWRRIRSTLFPASTEEPEIDRTAQSSAFCAGSLSKQEATRTWSAMSSW